MARLTAKQVEEQFKPHADVTADRRLLYEILLQLATANDANDPAGKPNRS